VGKFQVHAFGIRIPGKKKVLGKRGGAHAAEYGIRLAKGVGDFFKKKGGAKEGGFVNTCALGGLFLEKELPEEGYPKPAE